MADKASGRFDKEYQKQVEKGKLRTAYSTALNAAKKRREDLEKAIRLKKSELGEALSDHAKKYLAQRKKDKEATDRDTYFELRGKVPTTTQRNNQRVKQWLRLDKSKNKSFSSERRKTAEWIRSDREDSKPSEVRYSNKKKVSEALSGMSRAYLATHRQRNKIINNTKLGVPRKPEEDEKVRSLGAKANKLADKIPTTTQRNNQRARAILKSTNKQSRRSDRAALIKDFRKDMKKSEIKYSSKKVNEVLSGVTRAYLKVQQKIKDTRKKDPKNNAETHKKIRSLGQKAENLSKNIPTTTQRNNARARHYKMTNKKKGEKDSSAFKTKNKRDIIKYKKIKLKPGSRKISAHYMRQVRSGLKPSEVRYSNKKKTNEALSPRTYANKMANKYGEKKFKAAFFDRANKEGKREVAKENRYKRLKKHLRA